MYIYVCVCVYHPIPVWVVLYWANPMLKHGCRCIYFLFIGGWDLGSVQVVASDQVDPHNGLMNGGHDLEVEIHRVPRVKPTWFRTYCESYLEILRSTTGPN